MKKQDSRNNETSTALWSTTPPSPARSAARHAPQCWGGTIIVIETPPANAPLTCLKRCPAMRRSVRSAGTIIMIKRSSGISKQALNSPLERNSPLTRSKFSVGQEGGQIAAAGAELQVDAAAGGEEAQALHVPRDGRLI